MMQDVWNPEQRHAQGNWQKIGTRRGDYSDKLKVTFTTEEEKECLKYQHLHIQHLGYNISNSARGCLASLLCSLQSLQNDETKQWVCDSCNHRLAVSSASRQTHAPFCRRHCLKLVKNKARSALASSFGLLLRFQFVQCCAINAITRSFNTNLSQKKPWPANRCVPSMNANDTHRSKTSAARKRRSCMALIAPLSWAWASYKAKQLHLPMTETNLAFEGLTIWFQT